MERIVLNTTHRGVCAVQFRPGSLVTDTEQKVYRVWESPSPDRKRLFFPVQRTPRVGNSCAVYFPGGGAYMVEINTLSNRYRYSGETKKNTSLHPDNYVCSGEWLPFSGEWYASQETNEFSSTRGHDPNRYDGYALVLATSLTEYVMFHTSRVQFILREPERVLMVMANPAERDHHLHVNITVLTSHGAVFPALEGRVGQQVWAGMPRNLPAAYVHDFVTMTNEGFAYLDSLAMGESTPSLV